MIKKRTTWRVKVYLRKTEAATYVFSQTFNNKASNTMNIGTNFDVNVDLGDESSRSISSRNDYNYTQQLSYIQVVLHRIMTPVCAID